MKNTKKTNGKFLENFSTSIKSYMFRWNQYFQVCFLILISQKKKSDGLHEHTFSNPW